MGQFWQKGWLVNLHLKGNKFGSGILINDQGFILTAFHNVYSNTAGEHIIEKATTSLDGNWHQVIPHISDKNNISVQCPDKSLARKIDLIAIKAEGTSFTRSPLQIATELPKENDTVILLIYDLNNSKHNYWREEEATVGPLFYEDGFCFFPLHKINGIPGASGGGVFTTDGKLLGIIKQTRTDTQDYVAIFLGDPRLQHLFPPTSSSNSYADKPSTSEQPIPSITFNTPKIIDISVNELKALIPRVEILLLTVNKWERKALLSEMTPIDGKDGILQGALDRLTYRIGMFGNYCAAYTESTMGSGGRQGATLTAERAINELKPKAVLLLGIAFGIDSSEQKLGDVLIAESIQPYEFQKVHNDFSITYRGQASPCGYTLSERFRMRRDDWTPKHGDKSFDDVKVYQGLVLSGDKLVNNKGFRDALSKAFPTSIGGEMEGAGAYSAVSSPVEVILIKSICDWADGDKNDKAQPFAAFTATSLAKHVLSKPDVLHPLINTDYKNDQNHQNNQTHQPYQNPADKTKASINQTVEAKDNSSISGVVQVSGSINNSTINIGVQPSKTSNTINTNQNSNSLPFILEVRKQDLIDDISVAYKQLSTSLSEVDKTRINRLIKDLENELVRIEHKISMSSFTNIQNQIIQNEIKNKSNNSIFLNTWFENPLYDQNWLIIQQEYTFFVNVGPPLQNTIVGIGKTISDLIPQDVTHLFYKLDYIDVLVICPDAEVTPLANRIKLPPCSEATAEFKIKPLKIGKLLINIVLLIKNDPIHSTIIIVDIEGDGNS